LPVCDGRAGVAGAGGDGVIRLRISRRRTRGRELVEGSGEIMRAGGAMIFLRGVLKSAERPLFTFSGTIKRVKRRMPVAADATAK
jgi:acyl-coenzyme A thioesterase PaaI-like protein